MIQTPTPMHERTKLSMSRVEFDEQQAPGKPSLKQMKMKRAKTAMVPLSESGFFGDLKTELFSKQTR